MNWPVLSVLILNWNGHADTDRLLHQLTEQARLKSERIEILVLDNGSDTPPWSSWDSLSGVSILRSPQNLGFSGGMSLLAEQAKAPTLWLLNNDCVLDDDTLSQVLTAIAENVGDVVFPLVRFIDGEVQSRDSHWNGCLGWRVGQAPESRVPYGIFGDIFAAPLLAAHLVPELGLLPTYFHTYAEDFDACLAGAILGLRVMRDPRIVLSHRKFGSRPNDPVVKFHFRCQGAANLIISTLLNYQIRHFPLIPLLFVKICVFDFLRTDRGLLLRHPSTIVVWMSIPYRIVQGSILLAGVRRTRQQRRRVSDRQAWK